MNKAVVLVLCTVAFAGFAQYDVTHSTGAWNSWEDVHTLSNSIVSVKLVPQIGGRVMDFTIEENTPYWINADLFGQTFPDDFPMSGGDQKKFGGTVCWPMPQDWPWPPAPRLDHGIYTVEMGPTTAESTMVRLTSPIEEDWDRTPGLQLRREVTLFKASSRVRVKHELINKSGVPMNRGIRMVHQVPQSNCKDHRVYFEKGTSTSDGALGYTSLDNKADKAAQQFTLDEETGIVSFNCMDLGSKIGAYSTGGWNAYVSNTTGYALITYSEVTEPSEAFPDTGSNIIIWSGGANADYFEVEMQGPLAEIANDESIEWITDIYRTRVDGPILDVTRAGVVTEPLEVSGTGVTGKFAVFYAGRVDLVLSPGDNVAESWDVAPTEPLEVNRAEAPMAGTNHAALLLYDSDGAFVDTLDTEDYTSLGIGNVDGAAGKSALQAVHRSGMLTVSTPYAAHRVTVYSLDGRAVARFSGSGSGSHSYSFGTLGLGSYICRVLSGKRWLTQSIVIDK